MRNAKNVLLFMILFVGPFLSAQQPLPLSHDEIKLLLTSENISNDMLIKIIESRKVAYTLNNSQLIELVKLGADETIINAIENNPAVMITIERPQNNSQVLEGVLVSGTVMGTNRNLWVFVFPELAYGKCWPQSADPSKGLPASIVNNRYSVPCNLGGPAQRYDIVIYSADITASNIISNLLIKWSRDNHYPGLRVNELPTGVTEEYRISVVKN